MLEKPPQTMETALPIADIHHLQGGDMGQNKLCDSKVEDLSPPSTARVLHAAGNNNSNLEHKSNIA